MHRDLERLNGELARVLAGLDAEETQWRPGRRSGRRPGAWTIQQIVEHLLLTYSTTVQVVEARLAKGSPTKAVPTLKQRVQQFAVAKVGYFPAGRLAPEAVTPGSGGARLGGEDLLRRVMADLERMDAVLGRAEEMFGRRRAVSHVVLGPLSVACWRRFHRVHGRHHVRQIEAIRAEAVKV